MKEYSISVKTEGYEYYKVLAETFEDAVEAIKRGDVSYFTSEDEWASEFYFDDVREI